MASAMAMILIWSGDARPMRAPNEMSKVAAENSASIKVSKEIFVDPLKRLSKMILHSMFRAVTNIVNETAPSPYFSRNVILLQFQGNTASACVHET